MESASAAAGRMRASCHNSLLLPQQLVAATADVALTVRMYNTLIDLKKSSEMCSLLGETLEGRRSPFNHYL